ncbi:MAG: HAD-IC family P-type ATPase [bacterium]
MNKSVVDFSGLDFKDCFKIFQTSQKGLTQVEAAKRLKNNGFNEIANKKSTNLLLIFFKQFKSFLILILFIAAGISFVLNHFLDGWIILFVIFINSLIGLFFEYKAQKSLDALKKILKNSVRVIRSGKLLEIPSRELVIGDILVLEEGDKIQADCRLINSRDFYVSESALTGESEPVLKITAQIEKSNSISDKKNMIFAGTLVQAGGAEAVVVATAHNTEIGKIASQLAVIIKKPSNFERKSQYLAKQLAIVATVVSVLIFIVGFFIRKMEFVDIFLLTTSMLVSAIPEGLPAIVAVSLAIGAKKMSEKNAIIRNLSVAESLGAVTVVCTDKTGTITENKMTVQTIYLASQKTINSEQYDKIAGSGEIKDNNLKLFLMACMLGNKAIVGVAAADQDHELGDQTEVALKKLAIKFQLETDQYSQVDDLPFNSVNKFRAKLVESFIDGKIQKDLFVTGAPEVVLAMSNKSMGGEKIKSITIDVDNKILQFAQNGWRTIALAVKKIDSDRSSIEDEDLTDLEFLGIAAIRDPIRLGVFESVKETLKAGVKIKMLTGDHVQTAISIAKEVGLISLGDDIAKCVVTNNELENLNKSDFDAKVMQAKVFARLNPLMKYEITKSLQRQNQLVAMTGDGVNDAPALKQADVGVSMGKIGTDVARDSSDIVLADDNFNTIILSLKQGRIIFENIRKASYFLLSTNLAEVATILGALLIGIASPLSSVQILWLNLVTDGVNGAAISFENDTTQVLNRKPRDINENLLNKSVLPYLIIMVLVMAPLTLYTYFELLPQGQITASSGAFFVMSMTQLFNLVNLKSLKKSSLNKKLFDNVWLNSTVTISFLLVVFAPFTFIGNFLGLVPLDWLEMIKLTLLSSLVLWVMEGYKLVKNIIFS